MVNVEVVFCKHCDLKEIVDPPDAKPNVVDRMEQHIRLEHPEIPRVHNAWSSKVIEMSLEELKKLRDQRAIDDLNYFYNLQHWE